MIRQPYDLYIKPLYNEQVTLQEEWPAMIRQPYDL